MWTWHVWDESTLRAMDRVLRAPDTFLLVLQVTKVPPPLPN